MFCAVILALFGFSSAHAFGLADGRDSSVSMPELTRTGKAQIKIAVRNGHTLVDASIVYTGVSYDRLWRVSTDLDNYMRLNMPGLVQSSVVEQAPGNLFYLWSHMSLLGQDSKHYFEVRKAPEGSEWSQIGKRAPWPHPEDSAFKDVRGYWFLDEIEANVVYARYVSDAEVDSVVPDFIVDLVAKSHLRDAINDMMNTLYKEAARVR